VALDKSGKAVKREANLMAGWLKKKDNSEDKKPKKEEPDEKEG
jgi:hypothetical protein